MLLSIKSEMWELLYSHFVFFIVKETMIRLHTHYTGSAESVTWDFVLP